MRSLLWVAACLSLAGCVSRGERYYQRAERFFVQGQYRLAADEFRRVVDEHPGSPLADDAAYKLAYLYREEMEALPQAVDTYRFLAERYPDSPFADDALLWVMYLQAHELKDAAAARQTHALICERFRAQESVRARAHLQLVQALQAAGDPAAADTEARQLLRLYPNQRRQAAAAMLTRARLAEQMGKQPDAVVSLLEQVVKAYPDTLSAVEAKRTIGWQYYDERGRQRQAEHRAKVRAARTIGGVPDFRAEAGSPRSRPFDCLRSLLVQRGVRASREEVLAVSGVAFEFHYDPADPGATRQRLSRNALSLTAEQYGFAVITWSAGAAEASFASLTQSISQGRPVMVPQGHAGRWLIVTGYRPAEDRALVLPGRGRQARAMSRREFLGLWAASPRGHTACVTGPYFQFSLGQRLQTPTPEALLQAAAQRAGKAAGEGEGLSGTRAHEALAEHLAAAAEDPGAQARLREWAADSLPALMDDRQAAVAYLTGAGQAAAAEAYGEVARLATELRAVVLSLTRPAQGAEPPPEGSWPEAVELAREMRVADERGAQELAGLAR